MPRIQRGEVLDLELHDRKKEERLEALSTLFGDRKRVKCRVDGLKLAYTYYDTVEVEYYAIDEGFSILSFSILGDYNFPMQTIGAVLSCDGNWDDFSFSAHPTCPEGLVLGRGSDSSKLPETDLLDDLLFKVAATRRYSITDLKVGKSRSGQWEVE